MGWAEHMTCMCEKKMCIGFWYGNQKEEGNLENVAVDGRLILKWILKKQDIKHHEKYILSLLCLNLLLF
jgi:hypothetical protein